MFKNMKIWLRFVLSFSLILALMIVIILISLREMNSNYDKLKRIVEINNVRIQLANDLSDHARENAITLRNILLANNDIEEIKKMKDRIIVDRQIYDKDFKRLCELTNPDDTLANGLLAKAIAIQDTSRLMNNKVVELEETGKHDDAMHLMNSQARVLKQDWIDLLDKTIQYNIGRSLMRYQEAQEAQVTARTIIIILGLAAIALSLVIAILLTLSITKPLKIASNLVISRDLTIDLSAYQKGGGELGLMVRSFSKDISERIRLEEEMRAASLYARNLIEASLDPLVTISAEGKITDVNKTTEQVTGISRERLIGSDFADYFTEPDKARAGYKQVFSQGIVMDYPLTLRNAAGLTTDVLYNASIYRNEAGEVQGVFAAARDITERKRQEKELNAYRDQLEEMVKQRTADLSNVLTEVKETVNVLAASSTQILAATSQVASGTAETATAISETTTTVEEVQQAAKQVAQKAKNVADSAQRVAQVSQNGQKAVDETVTVMNRIREQMDLIAQTVVRLSEQSQFIGGIIASVTDIADQSNLLAVNAAIEAAKAGEQGKGFAVVAQEIKTLAGQSKQATSQVRNILNDVQKATGAAVMATEQGSKSVEAGVKQSAQTGEAIRLLAESSNEAVQAASQIVASSQQQVVGMDQIGVAMQNINQAGTETAVSMVQAEKSAKNLHELGQKLKELVNRFKE